MTVARSVRLPVEMLTPFLLTVESPRGGPPGTAEARAQAALPLDWCAVFGNDHPVELEVGFGKGLFLCNTAQAQPDRNYLGVEIERKYVLLAATRLARRNLANVKLACADARWFLANKVPDASLAAVHIYFPDPWWKQRHRKRRLFTAEFASRCARILRPGGRLHFATDVQEYFEESAGLVREVSSLAELPAPAEQTPRHDMDYLTNFERKFRKADLPIYRAVWERTGP